MSGTGNKSSSKQVHNNNISNDNVLDLTEDNSPEHPQPSSSRPRPNSTPPPPPRRQSAPGHTSGHTSRLPPNSTSGLILKSQTRDVYKPGASAPKQRAWDPAPMPPHASGSRGVPFQPMDPSLKKQHTTGSPYSGPFQNPNSGGFHDEQATKKPKRAPKKREDDGGVTLIGNALKGIGGQQSTSKSGLAGMAKIKRRDDHAEPEQPRVDQFAPAPIVPVSPGKEKPPALMIRGASKGKDKGKGKAKATEVINISDDDDDEEEETGRYGHRRRNGDDESDEIEDPDDDERHRGKRRPSFNHLQHQQRESTNRTKGYPQQPRPPAHRRVSEHDGGADPSSDDPMLLPGGQPFNITSKRRPGEITSEGGKLASKIVKKDHVPSVVSQLQGRNSKASTSKTPAELRNAVDGTDSQDMDHLPKQKAKKKTSAATKNTKSSHSFGEILTHAIGPYFFQQKADEDELPSNQTVDYELLLHPARNGKTPWTIRRGDPPENIFTFGYGDMERVEVSEGAEGHPPFLRFIFRWDTSVPHKLNEDLGLKPLVPGCHPCLTVQFQGAELGAGTALDAMLQHPQQYRTDNHFKNDAFLCSTLPPAALYQVSEQLERVLQKAARRSSRATSTRSQKPAARSETQKTLGFVPTRKPSLKQQAAPQPDDPSSEEEEEEPPKDAKTALMDRGRRTSDASTGTGNRRSSRQSTSTYGTSRYEPPVPEKDRVPAETVVLVYPIRDHSSVVSITHGDTKRLDEEEFLNDTLIEFGLKRALLLLTEREKEIPDESKHFSNRIHMFNSFFYKKLTTKRGPKGVDESYAAVRKWTNKFDLFDKKYIIIPINEHLHWFLAIIVNPGALLRFSPVDPTAGRTLRKNKNELPAPAPAPPLVPPPAGPPLADDKGTTSKFFPPPPKPTKSASEDNEVDMTGDSDDDEVKIAEALDNDDDKQENGVVTAEFQEAVRLSKHGGEDVDESGDAVMTDLNPAIEPRRGLVDYDSSDDGTSAEDQVAEELIISSATQEEKEDANKTKDNPVAAAAPAAASPAPSASQSRLPITFGPSKTAPGGSEQMEVDTPTPDPERVEPPPEEQCLIYTFDSLGGSHKVVGDRLRDYLRKEMADKKKMELDPEHLKLHVPHKAAMVPLQANFSDCGLYLLHYVEKFLEEPEKYLEILKGGPKDPNKGIANKKELQEKANRDWDGAAAMGKRKELHDEVDRLCVEWKEYRAPLDIIEAKEREEKRAKRLQQRQEDENKEAARRVTEQEEKDRKLPQADDDDDDDSMQVVEQAQTSAPLPPPPPAQPVQQPSPSPSLSNTKGKGKGKAAAPKGGKGGGRKKKETEVLILSDDDDMSSSPQKARSPSLGPPPPPPQAELKRGATASSFRPPTAGTAPTPIEVPVHAKSTTPAPSPPPSHRSAPTAAPVAQKPIVNHFPLPTSGPAPDSQVLPDSQQAIPDSQLEYPAMDGDVETPRPDSQGSASIHRLLNHDPTAAAATTTSSHNQPVASTSNGHHGTNGSNVRTRSRQNSAQPPSAVEEPLSPPPRKKRKQEPGFSAASAPASVAHPSASSSIKPTTPGTPGAFAGVEVPLRSHTHDKTSTTARHSSPVRQGGFGASSGTHTRFKDNVLTLDDDEDPNETSDKGSTKVNASDKGFTTLGKSIGSSTTRVTGPRKSAAGPNPAESSSDDDEEVLTVHQQTRPSTSSRALPPPPSGQTPSSTNATSSSSSRVPRASTKVTSGASKKQGSPSDDDDVVIMQDEPVLVWDSKAKAKR